MMASEAERGDWGEGWRVGAFGMTDDRAMPGLNV